VHGFWIFDERHVIAENLTAELNITQPGEVQGYLRAFAQLAEIACYGAEVRNLITRVLDELLASGC
jgi:hypothetical protein